MTSFEELLRKYVSYKPNRAVQKFDPFFGLYFGCVFLYDTDFLVREHALEHVQNFQFLQPIMPGDQFAIAITSNDSFFVDHQPI